MRSYEEEGRRERQRWLETVRSNESALRGNRGNPRLLHSLANVYFGYDIDAEGDDPVVRIEHALFDDRGLIETALGALRATIDREDVPDIEETIRLSQNNRIPLLALPYLAGLAEIERTSQDESCRFDESRMSKALVFLYAIRLEERPEWYRRLIVSHPEFVAGVLVRFVAARLREGVEHILPLYDLTDGDAHAQVARFGPRHENTCRDNLLSKLRELLPREVDAQPEGRHVNDKRADIRVNVACGGFQVPVEIKKSGSLVLWKALRSQLIEHYTRDPATDGYGIYLVLWFGQQHMPPAPAGARPTSASELRHCLQSTLSEDEARKISVVVVDVTPPG